MAREYNQGVFVPHNPQKYRGNPTQIIYRSGWELHFMKRMDTDPAIVRWSSEETIVHYRHPATGRVNRYFPDFIIEAKQDDGSIDTIMIEIKPFKETQVPENRPRKKKKTLMLEQYTYAVNAAKWEAAQIFCKRKGWKFMVMTEKELGLYDYP